MRHLEHPDPGFDLGLRLLFSMHEVMYEGDDREFVGVLDEMRSHAKHLDPDNPVAVAVGMLATAFGVGTCEFPGVIWDEDRLRASVADLLEQCQEVPL